MIPAKISNLNPVQVTYSKHPKPDRLTFVNETHRLWPDAFADALYLYERFKVIADVENLIQWHGIWKWSPTGFIRDRRDLSINQQVFIELTGEGKCKIIKL